jgi:hypothetical protein
VGRPPFRTVQTEGDVMQKTIEERLAPYGPATCPTCGQYRRVYVRVGDELVCLGCKEANDGSPRRVSAFDEGADTDS